jgi:predicted small secreted protein
MKKIAALLAVAFLLAACNTMEGLGQDVKKAGSKIEDSAAKKK